MMQKHQLERNRFRRAFANAGTAFDAVITDFGNTIFDGDGTDGAGTDTSFATNAFFFLLTQRIPVITTQKNWHLQWDSNPCYRDENPMS